MMPGRAPDARTIRHVTCLGCGCTCDDLAVETAGGRIVRVDGACPLGEAWFGDGGVPARAMIRGAAAAHDAAVERAANVLRGAERVLVWLGPELSCEAQREAVAIADRLGAFVDVGASAAERALLLATQRRGIATATLGELRHHADVVVLWGVDPARTHPRFLTRFVEARGDDAPNGRGSRRVIAADIAERCAAGEVDGRVTLRERDEVEALALLRLLVLARALPPHPSHVPDWLGPMRELAARLRSARYAAIVCDAGGEQTDARRSEGLVALVQALNGATRAALIVLRPGGNRGGAEAVLTWQTGFPAAVDFARGAPRYEPLRLARDLIGDGSVDAVLALGVTGRLGLDEQGALASVDTVIVGPRASEHGHAAAVAIDTGVVGIHEAGLALRMDGVPLPARAVVGGAPTAVEVLRALRARLAAREALV